MVRTYPTGEPKDNGLLLPIVLVSAFIALFAWAMLSNGHLVELLAFGEMWLRLACIAAVVLTAVLFVIWLVSLVFDLQLFAGRRILWGIALLLTFLAAFAFLIVSWW